MPRRISPSPSTDTGLTNPCRLTTDRTRRPVPKRLKRLLGSTAESRVVTLDCNPVYINRKVDTNVRFMRLGLLPDVRDVDLTRVPVPAQEPGQAKGDGVNQYTSSNRGRHVPPPDRPFERWPDSDPLGAPAAPVQATYAPAYPALHAHATTDTHPGAPPSAQPSQYGWPPRSHGRFEERPYVVPDQSQTETSSESAPVGEKQAINAPSRHYDARARDARFQPYSRPRPRFLDENGRDPSTRRTLAPGGGARHQEAGGDALQTHTLERHDFESHGYDGRPFPSPQPSGNAAVQEVVDFSRVSTFARQAAHAQSDDLIQADPTRFTPPSKTSQPSEQREHARVEDIAYRDIPCRICAYQHKHVHPDALLRCAHLAPTAPSATATDAPYGLDEAVNISPGHTYTEPVPPAMPIQPSAIQQQACPSPHADRPSSPRPLRLILAQPDDDHATMYYRLSSDNEHGDPLQQEHVSIHAPSKSSSEQMKFGNARSWGDSQELPQITGGHAGEQHEDPLAVEASSTHNRQLGDSYSRLLPGAIPVQRPLPGRDTPLWAAQAGDPRVHPAPYLAQTPQYQGETLRLRSMVAQGGAVMACLVPLTLQRSTCYENPVETHIPF